MDNKPLMLILDQKRDRSPLMTHYYEYLIKLKEIDVIWSEEVKTPLKDTINKIGRVPNIIYYGFAIGNALEGAAEAIKNHNIKIILDPGDYEELIHIKDKGRFRQFQGVEINYIVARMPRVEKHATLDLLQNFINTNDILKVRNSKIIHIPWGIDITKYPKNDNKDIDVSLLCTVSGYCGYHEKRLKANYTLEKLSSKIKIFACTNIGPKISADKPIFGEEYYNIISRSKLFIVDGSGRDFPVQKYFEAPACGALVIGEIPTPLQKILVRNESAIPTIPENLEEDILDILNKPDKLKEMAKEGQKRMLENFSMDKVVKELMEVICE